MTLVSKLTIPALIGGIIALAIAGMFSPRVQASWFQHDIIAQVTGVPAERVLNVRTSPGIDAELVGTIARNAFVWVENCVGPDARSGWCLVERGGTRGWVSAEFITPHNN